MTYSVKEIYYTLQGEGAQTGKPAVFCRFAGCNLWSGRESDRASAVCKFCDTDFVGTDGHGGGKFISATLLADTIDASWLGASTKKLVVFTGGEPALQLDTPLIESLHHRSFSIAIETNGTTALPSGIDWVCVSPKSTAELLVKNGQELKLVYPQEDANPDRFETMNFEYFFLQPMDGPDLDRNTQSAIDYCMKNSTWRLSLQTHKYLDIP